MTSTKSMLLLAALVAGMLFTACGDADENATDNATANQTANNSSTPKTNPLKGDADAIANGEAAYMQACASCHSIDNTANPASNNVLISDSAKKEDGFLYDAISEGVADTIMAPYKSTYDETQIWELVSYIQSRG